VEIRPGARRFQPYKRHVEKQPSSPYRSNDIQMARAADYRRNQLAPDRSATKWKIAVAAYNRNSNAYREINFKFFPSAEELI